MKNRKTVIANRISEVFLSGRWIANTNYKEQIECINWQQATQKYHQLNSIADLIYHVNYFLDELLRSMETGKVTGTLKHSFTIPPINAEEDWRQISGNLLTNAEKLMNIMLQMDVEVLDKPFINARLGTLMQHIDAVIEHSYYHLGQITLIRKMTSQIEA